MKTKLQSFALLVTVQVFFCQTAFSGSRWRTLGKNISRPLMSSFNRQFLTDTWKRFRPKEPTVTGVAVGAGTILPAIYTYKKNARPERYFYTNKTLSEKIKTIFAREWSIYMAIAYGYGSQMLADSKFYWPLYTDKQYLRFIRAFKKMSFRGKIIGSSIVKVVARAAIDNKKEELNDLLRKKFFSLSDTRPLKKTENYRVLAQAQAILADMKYRTVLDQLWKKGDVEEMVDYVKQTLVELITLKKSLDKIQLSDAEETTTLMDIETPSEESMLEEVE